MAAITPGNGGTLRSTILENAFHEALSRVILWELDVTKNPQNNSTVTLISDFRAGRNSGTFTFTVGRETVPTGATSFPIQEHLTNTGFTPGTGGFIKSATIGGAIVELAEAIQTREKNSLKNPQGLNIITSLNYESEADRVTGVFDYLILQSVDASGNVITIAKPYLLD